MGPDPNKSRPNPDIPGLVYIKNTIKNPNIIVGDYTYYFDTTGTDNFEDHVTNFYSFSKDKLIIGKFCDIATGIEFVMGAANHRMNCVTTYPFYIMGNGWGSAIAPHEPILSNSNMDEVKSFLKRNLKYKISLILGGKNGYTGN